MFGKSRLSEPDSSGAPKKFGLNELGATAYASYVWTDSTSGGMVAMGSSGSYPLWKRRSLPLTKSIT